MWILQHPREPRITEAASHQSGWGKRRGTEKTHHYARLHQGLGRTTNPMRSILHSGRIAYKHAVRDRSANTADWITNAVQYSLTVRLLFNQLIPVRTKSVIGTGKVIQLLLYGICTSRATIGGCLRQDCKMYDMPSLLSTTRSAALSSSKLSWYHNDAGDRQ